MSACSDVAETARMAGGLRKRDYMLAGCGRKLVYEGVVFDLVGGVTGTHRFRTTDGRVLTLGVESVDGGNLGADDREALDELADAETIDHTAVRALLTEAGYFNAPEPGAALVYRGVSFEPQTYQISIVHAFARPDGSTTYLCAEPIET